MVIKFLAVMVNLADQFKKSIKTGQKKLVWQPVKGKLIAMLKLAVSAGDFSTPRRRAVRRWRATATLRALSGVRYARIATKRSPSATTMAATMISTFC